MQWTRYTGISVGYCMFMSSTKHMYVSCTVCVCVCVDCGGKMPYTPISLVGPLASVHAVVGKECNCFAYLH